MAAKKKVIELDGFCLGSCHSIKKRSDFYKTNNRHTRSGLSRYCKECSLAIFKDNLKTYKSLESATYYTCAEIGVPFVKRAFDVMEEKIKGIKEPNYVSQYMSSLTMIKKNSDIFDGFDKTDTALGDITSIRDHERSIEEQAKDLRLIWGDKTVEQLQFLESRFTAYTEGKKLTEFQSKCYRTLCRAELDEYEGNDIKVMVEIQSKMAQKLGIDKFEIEKDKSTGEKMLETWIFNEEQTNPADYYKDKEKFEDFCNIGKDYGHIMRSIKNLVTGSREYPGIK